MKCVIKLICLFGTCSPFVSSGHVPFFRKDYTYIDEFDAHYKLHWDGHGLSWDGAFLACEDEGATLFYPKLNGEWAVVKNLTDNLIEPPNVTDIFVGLHDKFGVGQFVTVDGQPTPSPLSVAEPDSVSGFPEGNCVIMNIETGAYKIRPCVNPPHVPLPFVCKRIDDKPCPTIDREYKYIKFSKKCYKVNRRLRSWDEAMRTCFMEGGSLTVLQNKEEASALQDILTSLTVYHVGIRRTSLDGDYYSVKGTQLDELYHREMDSNSYYEQNGVRIEDLRLECGAIFVTSRDTIYTTTQNCDNHLHFICEMDANLLQNK